MQNNDIRTLVSLYPTIYSFQPSLTILNILCFTPTDDNDTQTSNVACKTVKASVSEKSGCTRLVAQGHDVASGGCCCVVLYMNGFFGKS